MTSGVIASSASARAPGVGSDLTPLLVDRGGVAVASAFVCQEFACRLPVSDPDALREQLDALVTGR